MSLRSVAPLFEFDVFVLGLTVSGRAISVFLVLVAAVAEVIVAHIVKVYLMMLR